jgi:hypothetical protein
LPESEDRRCAECEDVKNELHRQKLCAANLNCANERSSAIAAASICSINWGEDLRVSLKS